MPRPSARSCRPLSCRRFAAALAAVVALTVTLAATPRVTRAQGFGDFIKQKLQQKKNEIEDSLSGVVVDKATGLTRCVATNSGCIKKTFSSGKHVQLVDASGKPVAPADSAKAVAAAGGVPPALAASDTTAAPAPAGSPAGAGLPGLPGMPGTPATGNAPAKPAAPTPPAPAAAPAAPATPATPASGEGVFVNYDFVPGDRVLFAEDFSQDNVGDFPRRLDLKSGNFEVADWQGERFLRTTSTGTVVIPLPEVLPSRFTFEADFAGSRSGAGWSVVVHFADSGSGDLTAAYFSPAEGGLRGAGVTSMSRVPDAAVQPISHFALMADGRYAKAYVNGVRVANMPNANLGRGKTVLIDFTAYADGPQYMTNIRIAAGGKPLYDALEATGRVSTHGILFATGSDQIRPESKPTLDEIGKMLAAHPDLKLRIEGYTDNVGQAAANQTLSEQRAAAVKQYLITNYQVAETRLASKGFGATKPAASNDTPEGRQQNRRVELVKM